MGDTRIEDQPFDRLTGLCAEMTQVLERDENDDVRAIVFLSDQKMGGIQFHGYEGGSSEGLAALFYHLQHVFKAQGGRLMLLTEDGADMLAED